MTVTAPRTLFPTESIGIRLSPSSVGGATPTTPAASIVASARDPWVVAPPRLNFAGFCDYCGQRGCQSPRCVAVHASTRWVVCGMCEGLGVVNDITECPHCHWGVAQVNPNYAGGVTPCLD